MRLFGSLAGATATFIGGLLYVNNPDSIFWFGSGSALLLCLLLYLARVKGEDSPEEQKASASAASINKKDVLEIMKLKSFWAFALIIVGTASIYDVFDQQFPNYYVTFFDSKEAGIDTFSKLCSAQTALEAVLMVFAPALSVLVITLISVFTLKNDKKPRSKSSL